MPVYVLRECVNWVMTESVGSVRCVQAAGVWWVAVGVSLGCVARVGAFGKIGYVEIGWAIRSGEWHVWEWQGRGSVAKDNEWHERRGVWESV